MPVRRSDPVPAEASSAVPAVDRALRILDLLASSPRRRFPLAEVARQLGIPKSTCLNLCGALEAGGILRRSREGYQLGRRLVQLGSDYVASVDPVREFYEVCRDAPADLGALVQLSVLDDSMNAVFLAREDLNSGLRLGLTAEIGRRVPAHLTAAGKALLAALPEADFEARLIQVAASADPRLLGARTVDEVRTLVGRTRADGFGTDEEETVPGVACVGRALPTAHREADHVAISISAAKPSLNPARRRSLKRTLDALGAALRDRL